jgi:C1A family cysteine protease
MDESLLRSIRAANTAAQVSWEAGETSMLALTPDERRHRLGYVPGPGEPTLPEREESAARAARAERSATAAPAFPPSWDWRNVAGRSFISPVKDQGSCGSCVAFGTAATIDGTVRVIKNIAVTDANG